jgi:hypothetical protein
VAAAGAASPLVQLACSASVEQERVMTSRLSDDYMKSQRGGASLLGFSGGGL